ncbi:Hypp6115 [Branchiostoma lanceolatum]|uniref:Hypp6115 protein n=1 Tax=Branchiostoma lanceolatum TaxID=7740 RepID=A0A8J9VIY7_BRALA|nr:Hypp6115 [Branchiostoma lanceolatum]
MQSADAPTMKFRMYHRPGAPFAGIMTNARMGDAWIQVCWVPEKKKVLELFARRPERRVVTLKEAYLKRGCPVLEVEARLAEE